MTIQDIQEWHSLWPKRKDVSSSSYMLGTVGDCVKKMQKFCKDNKTITKETIFAATKLYLKEKQLVNYAYISRPYYFINKLERGSLLAEYCESVLAGQTEAKQEPTENTYEPASDFL